MSFGNEEDIYQEHVLDHYEDPFHRGSCENPTHFHKDDNPLCSDVIQIEMAIDQEGKIRDLWFDGEGCVISQASASMLLETMEGKTVEDVRNFTADEMLELFQAKLTPNRQKCCLLSWRVIQQAIFKPLEEDGEATGGPQFLGPDLGEET